MHSFFFRSSEDIFLGLEYKNTRLETVTVLFL